MAASSKMSPGVIGLLATSVGEKVMKSERPFRSPNDDAHSQHSCIVQECWLMSVQSFGPGSE